jgi:hypothetical protein
MPHAVELSELRELPDFPDLSDLPVLPGLSPRDDVLVDLDNPSPYNPSPYNPSTDTTKKFVDQHLTHLINQDMLVVLPADLDPAPEDPYYRHWVGKHISVDEHRQNCYDPNEVVDYRTVVSHLWDGVCNREVDRQIVTQNGVVLSGNAMECNTADLVHCRRFDHVDFYRIIYITVVLGKGIRDIEDIDIQRIAAVLNMVERPYGYEKTLSIREPAFGKLWNYTPEEIRRLFDILNKKEYPGRDLAFQRVLEWVASEEHSINTILFLLPEALLSLQGELKCSGPLAWQAIPFWFMYKLEAYGWYQEML